MPGSYGLRLGGRVEHAKNLIDVLACGHAFDNGTMDEELHNQTKALIESLVACAADDDRLLGALAGVFWLRPESTDEAAVSPAR